MLHSSKAFLQKPTEYLSEIFILSIIMKFLAVAVFLVAATGVLAQNPYEYVDDALIQRVGQIIYEYDQKVAASRSSGNTGSFNNGAGYQVGKPEAVSRASNFDYNQAKPQQQVYQPHSHNNKSTNHVLFNSHSNKSINRNLLPVPFNSPNNKFTNNAPLNSPNNKLCSNNFQFLVPFVSQFNQLCNSNKKSSRTTGTNANLRHLLLFNVPSKNPKLPRKTLDLDTFSVKLKLFQELQNSTLPME
ncbi:hypothetical protein Ocin01_13828 [Orchesella cincta]|uniref:Uncharacterized protein n=1 Tax=Orchesella cincta TaxID=48709 RepID=A0A1D2MIS4_ORCCI|nr:hypothetical protein Ocin01_13828 [Orchesella cincta]